MRLKNQKFKYLKIIKMLMYNSKEITKENNTLSDDFEAKTIYGSNIINCIFNNKIINASL